MTARSAIQLTSREEAFLFGLIHPSYEPHKLTHGVTVIVRWAEGVLGYCPPGWEDDKVCYCCACMQPSSFGLCTVVVMGLGTSFHKRRSRQTPLDSHSTQLPCCAAQYDADVMQHWSVFKHYNAAIAPACAKEQSRGTRLQDMHDAICCTQRMNAICMHQTAALCPQHLS